MCGSLVLVVVSVSSLNVAIPEIQRALHASGSDLQWIIDSYALVFAGLLLPAGAIGDRFGRREALLVGLSVFGVAAIGGTFAESSAQLIAWRGLMGVGAALIMPATLSIVSAVFGPAERSRAIAIWAGFAGAGGVVGLLASGVLLKSFWWGSVMAINVPIALVMIVAVVAVVPTSRDPDATPLDPVGGVLSMVGLVALVFGIIEGPEKGWTSGVTLAAFALALVALTGFIVWELHTTYPMLDPRFFTIRQFGVGSATLTATFFGIFAMFFVITQYLQFVQQHDPLAAGLRILPYGVVLLLVAPRSAVLSERHGERAVILAGALITSTGFVILGLLRPDTSYWVTGTGLVVLALGTGLLMPPATTALLAALPPAKAGVGSAMNDTTREVGGAIGIAVGGALLSIGYRQGLDGELGGLDPAVAEGVEDSFGALLSIPEAADLVEVGRQAFTDGMQLAMFVSAAVLLLTAIPVAILFPRRTTTEGSPS